MNNHSSVKNAIDSRLAALQMDEGFINQRSQRAEARPPANRKPLIAAAICLCLALAIPVMASSFPGFNKLLSLVSQETAGKLQPVEMTSESNGIKMEVVAAMNDDDAAVVYLTMQDLTGNRIDRSMALYANYHITGASGFHSEVVDFDEKTRTATMRIQAFGADKWDGKKVTLHINSFVSGKHLYYDIDTGLNLNQVAKTPDTIVYDLKNNPGGGGDLYPLLYNQGKINILAAGTMSVGFPGIDFLKITNIGLVDNRLHIRAIWSGDVNRGNMNLVDSKGQIVNPTSISLDSSPSKNGIYSEELIFPVGASELEKYRLKGNFVEYEQHIKGNWHSTFTINAIDKARERACSIKNGDINIYSVTISPIGITLKATGKQGPGGANTDQLNVSLKTIHGSTINRFDSVNAFNEAGKITIKCIPAAPLEIDTIDSVIINGESIAFRD